MGRPIASLAARPSMRSSSWGRLGRADGRVVCGSSLHQTHATHQPTVSHPRPAIHGARLLKSALLTCDRRFRQNHSLHLRPPCCHAWLLEADEPTAQSPAACNLHHDWPTPNIGNGPVTRCMLSPANHTPASACLPTGPRRAFDLFHAGASAV